MTRNALSKSLLDRILDWVFGYDVFVSYTRIEWGEDYAVALGRALSEPPHELQCFVDSMRMETGNSWRLQGCRALRKSRKIVLLVSPAVNRSPGVRDELTANKALGRRAKPVSIIDIAGAWCNIAGDPSFVELLSTEKFPLTESLRIVEPNAVLPSDSVVARIITDFKLRTENNRRLRLLAGIAICLAALALFAELNRREARARALEVQIRESVLLANFARQQTEAGDATTGALLALRGLPSEDVDRPLVGEAAGALIEALADLREGAGFVLGAAEFFVSPDGDAAIIASSRDGNQLWDLVSDTRVPLPHDRPLGVAAFSSDGQLLATGDWDGIVKLWQRDGTFIRSFNLGNQSPVLLAFSKGDLGLISVSQDGYARGSTLTGESEELDFGPDVASFRSAAFDADSATLAGGSDDGSVVISVGGTPLRTVEPPPGAYSPVLQLDRDARQLLVLWPTRDVVVVNLTDGRLTAIPTGPHTAVGALSPDGETVVIGEDDGSVAVWSSMTGQHVADLRGHTDAVLNIAFDPGGTMLATSSDDGTIRLWHATDWAPLATLSGHLGPVPHIAFVRGGSTLVSSSHDETVRTWAARSQREAMKLTGHTNAIYSATASDDGRTVATTSRDRTVRFWDLPSGRGATLGRPETGPIYRLAFGPIKGQFALNVWDHQLEIWQLEPTKLLGQFNVQGDLIKGQISHDGQFVLEGHDGALRVVEARAKSIVKSLDVPPTQVGAFHPTQPFLLIAAGETLSLLEIPSGRVVSTTPIFGDALRVGFDDTGAQAYAQLSNDMILVFGVPELSLKITTAGSEQSEVIVLPACDTVVTTSGSGTVTVWHLASGRRRLNFSTRDPAPRIAVDPTCRRLAMTGDELVKVVDLTDGADVATLHSPSLKLRFAMFLFGSVDLLTADEAGNLDRWRIPMTVWEMRKAAEMALPRTLSEEQELRFGLR